MSSPYSSGARRAPSPLCGLLIPFGSRRELVSIWLLGEMEYSFTYKCLTAQDPNSRVERANLRKKTPSSACQMGSKVTPYLVFGNARGAWCAAPRQRLCGRALGCFGFRLREEPVHRINKCYFEVHALELGFILQGKVL